MSRKKDTSLLYDPELSMSEEQLRREINEINKEIGSIRVEELETPISRYTRGDSGIASTRRRNESPRQSNVSPFDTKKRQSSVSLDMGTRAKPQLTESLTTWTVRTEIMISELEIDTCLK